MSDFLCILGDNFERNYVCLVSTIFSCLFFTARPKGPLKESEKLPKQPSIAGRKVFVIWKVFGWERKKCDSQLQLIFFSRLGNLWTQKFSDTTKCFGILWNVSGPSKKFLNTLESFWTFWKNVQTLLLKYWNMFAISIFGL